MEAALCICMYFAFTVEALDEINFFFHSEIAFD